MRFLALDPGKTSGWAIFEDAQPVSMGQEMFPEIFEWLPQVSPLDVYVVENYIIRPPTVQKGYMHQWNKGEALQIIGAVKQLGLIRGIPVKIQEPSIKPTAARLTGLPYSPGKSGTHMQDAILHGAYFYRREVELVVEEGNVPEDASEAGGGKTPQSGVRNPARVRKIQSWSGLRKARDS